MKAFSALLLCCLSAALVRAQAARPVAATSDRASQAAKVGEPTFAQKVSPIAEAGLDHCPVLKRQIEAQRRIFAASRLRWTRAWLSPVWLPRKDGTYFIARRTRIDTKFDVERQQSDWLVWGTSVVSLTNDGSPSAVLAFQRLSLATLFGPNFQAFLVANRQGDVDHIEVFLPPPAVRGAFGRSGPDRILDKLFNGAAGPADLQDANGHFSTAADGFNWLGNVGNTRVFIHYRADGSLETARVDRRGTADWCRSLAYRKVDGAIIPSRVRRYHDQPRTMELDDLLGVDLHQSALTIRPDLPVVDFRALVQSRLEGNDGFAPPTHYRWDGQPAPLATLQRPPKPWFKINWQAMGIGAIFAAVLLGAVVAVFRASQTPKTKPSRARHR
jgi:hypothetical protein